MKQNEIALLALIASAPGLRAAQIADRLDQAIDDVDALLRPHLIAGNVVEEEVTAPNRFPAMAYDLSEQFKATEVFRAIAAGRDPDAPVAALVQPSDAGAGEAGGKDDVDPGKAGSKIDRAVACVTEFGSVTNGQLRVSMGLNAGQYPTAFLQQAIRDGRLARDGENWVLGHALALAIKTSVIEERKPEIKIPVFAGTLDSKALAPPAAAAVGELPVEQVGFRCAVWSDGILELQRGGKTIASLQPGERDQLADLLS